MGTTVNTDIKIYSDQVHGGMFERLQSNLNAFNAASGGCIQLSNSRIRGHYGYDSFFKNMGSTTVARRDTTDVTTNVTATALTGDELISVKLNRGFQIEATLDAMKKRAPDADGQQLLSYIAGEQVAEFITLDYLNSGLRACNASLAAQSALCVAADAATASARLTHDVLAQGLATNGDQAGALGLIVCHSAPYFGLVRQTIADKLLEATAYTITTGTPQTLNRRVLVTDSTALVHQAAVAAVGTLTFASGNKIQGTGVGTGAKVGGYCLVAGATTAANNGTKRIVTVTSANEIIVAETIAAEAGGSSTCALQATYNTLVLKPGAIGVAESEVPSVVAQLITGKPNLIWRMQGEHAFNVGVLGCQWDVGNGGLNPTDAAIATGSNWDKVYTDVKQLAGARLVTC